ncbi:MAG TPA: C13 family peptidase [Steroidobacteraceae bacterium]|nr:C13 family peptidase [Steroidobacteraceae bacterium]
MFFLRLLIVSALVLGAGARGHEPARVTQPLVDRQPALIDAQVRSMAEHAAPGPQGYFVGFAGVGEEHVFAEEIDLAARRLAQRYGVGSRSLRLVNDQRDLETWPLATARALDYALQALGRVMDDDDVLFLALSSHGGDDATLAVSSPGIRPQVLEATDLARMLRESGIRWRVIVISACYSGGFIKPLADERTIVITAASKSRPSFGCGVQRDLTYFGEAFWRDALPRARSMRAALQAARREITIRERAEHTRPSHPQGWFGRQMEAKLAEMEMGTVPLS